MHSNLCLVSHKGEEYTSGPHKEWDVDAENPDLELSLSALDIVDDASGSEIQVASSSIEALILLNMHLILFLMMRMRINMICIGICNCRCL